MKILTSFGRVLILSILCVAASASSHVEHSQNALASTLAPELERARNVASADSVLITLEGAVFAPDGTPAEGAVVVSSAGGQAVTEANGEFQLEARVPREAESIQITAVGGAGGRLLASQHVSLSVTSGSVILAPLQLAQSSACTPSWLPTFGAEPGVSIDVNALVVFDDGTGAALHAAGRFRMAGGQPMNQVVKWDGSNWTPLGGGIRVGSSSSVNALAVFDDGSGPALFAGGFFDRAGTVDVNHIAKWDGTDWSALGIGMNSTVNSLTVFDDGNGELLYAGGFFTLAGGVPANRVAKWDGSIWSRLRTGIEGSGTSTTVLALVVFDDGTGAALHAGGKFTTAGAAPANFIARWDGAAWTSVGTGMNSEVAALAVFDDGTGAALYAGGKFAFAGGVPASRIAKWDGSSWSALGSGITTFLSIRSLFVFDDGTGERLYAGEGTGAPVVLSRGNIASWDGSTWMPLDSGLDGAVHAIASFDDGNGERLFAGGYFSTSNSTSNSVTLNKIAKWSGSTWQALGSGLDHPVQALTVFDAGNGKRLYVGGVFTSVAGVAANRVAEWDGSSWRPLGPGIPDGSVNVLATFDDGTGEKLIVGGLFTMAGGVPANNIASWDGSSWTALANGLTGLEPAVHSLKVFDDGNGERLFVGGEFTVAGAVSARRIAKWDGSSWSALDSGVNSPTGTVVSAIEVFDDGGGERLYVAGTFFVAGGAAAIGIASWDGMSWSPVGGGLAGNSGAALSLAVFDEGSGERLFAGGVFTSAGGATANGIARWDGSSWSDLGTGINSGVRSLIVFDDGQGEGLFAGGGIITAAGSALAGVAKWDGSGWTPISSSVFASALAVFDDGTGEALFAGGAFRSSLDSRDSYLAKWGCYSTLTNDFCNGDGGDQLGCTNCPCGNNAAPGTLGGCLNSALTSSRLIASGNLSVSLPANSTDDLRFALTGAPPTAFCTLNSGDAVAPNNPVNPCFGLGSGVQAMQLDGLRCAIVNTRRHGGRSADVDGSVGAVTAAWGGSDNPPVGIAQAGGGFAAGQTRYFQVFHRDDPLLGCMRALNTSQAIEITFQP